MPPKESPARKRRRLAISRGVTSSATDFLWMCRRRPERIGIVAEGDSWFAYPRKWLALGADINIVHHVEDNILRTNTTNLLRLASNGDEAVAMMSGKQKERLDVAFRKGSARCQWSSTARLKSSRLVAKW